MTAGPASALLRPGLLAGRVIAVAGGAPAVVAACVTLGADVHPVAAPLLDEEAVGAAVAAIGPVDVLVADAATPFRMAEGGLGGLRAAVDGAWNAIRAVATQAWISGGRPGVVLVVAPSPGAGEHAAAVGAALENTIRTLSTEWARYGIVATAVRPGDVTTDEEVAHLVAFLASRAGAYYSGDVFTLGPGVTGAGGGLSSI